MYFLSTAASNENQISLIQILFSNELAGLCIKEDARAIAKLTDE